MLEGGGRGSTTTLIIFRILYEAFCDLYESVPEYLAQIEELMPWHDRINVMCKSFHQFCVANRKHFPVTSFATCPNIGTYGVDIKVVAAFLSWLRFKTHGTSSKQIRKVSTIHNLWQQTRSGLRAALAPTTHKPDWLSCLTSHAHGKFVWKWMWGCGVQVSSWSKWLIRLHAFSFTIKMIYEASCIFCWSDVSGHMHFYIEMTCHIPCIFICFQNDTSCHMHVDLSAKLHFRSNAFFIGIACFVKCIFICIRIALKTAPQHQVNKPPPPPSYQLSLISYESSVISYQGIRYQKLCDSLAACNKVMWPPW